MPAVTVRLFQESRCSGLRGERQIGSACGESDLAKGDSGRALRALLLTGNHENSGSRQRASSAKPYPRLRAGACFDDTYHRDGVVAKLCQREETCSRMLDRYAGKESTRRLRIIQKR